MKPNQASADDKRNGIVYKWVGGPDDIFVVRKLDKPHHGRKYMSAVMTQKGDTRAYSTAFHMTVRKALEWLNSDLERFIRKGSWR